MATANHYIKMTNHYIKHGRIYGATKTLATANTINITDYANGDITEETYISIQDAIANTKRTLTATAKALGQPKPQLSLAKFIA